MEEHLLERGAEEILRFGRHPLVVCDDTSHAVAGETVAASLRSAGVAPREFLHHGFCNRDDALAAAQSGALDGVDVVVGCGGGVILDFAKCLAHLADAPLVTVPTSSAQCCAYTSIAVCYTREGRYVSTSHFSREPAAALLDLTVLSRQPPRLLAAGALDAMAKKIEIEFWTQLDAAPPPPSEGGVARSIFPVLPPSERGVAPEGPGGVHRAAPSAPSLSAPPLLRTEYSPSLASLGSPLSEGAGQGIASAVSDFIYGDLDAKIDPALADLAKGVPTPALRDVVFDSIVGAGIVSGISGGSRQVALAHRFYYGARTLHPSEAARYTHGELVAVGLVLQHAYNGRPDEAQSLAGRLRRWGLAASMGELGFDHGESDARAWFDYILGTKTMKAAVAADPGAPVRLREALKGIFQ